MRNRVPRCAAAAWWSFFRWEHQEPRSRPSSFAVWLCSRCAAESPGDCAPRPSYSARAPGPPHPCAFSRLPGPIEPSAGERPGEGATLGLVARALQPPGTGRPRPRAACLPSVGDHGKPMAPRDTGSPYVAPHALLQRADGPTRRGLRPAADCPHTIARPLQPEKHALEGQAFWRLPSAHQQSETDEEADEHPVSRRAGPPYDLPNE